MENQKIEMKQASVYCVGIKKRCRNVDHHTLKLPEVLASEFSSEQALTDAIALVGQSMKTVQQAKLTVHPFAMEDLGNGVIVRSYTIALGFAKSLDITEAVRK